MKTNLPEAIGEVRRRLEQNERVDIQRIARRENNALAPGEHM